MSLVYFYYSNENEIFSSIEKGTEEFLYLVGIL